MTAASARETSPPPRAARAIPLPVPRRVGSGRGRNPPIPGRSPIGAIEALATKLDIDPAVLQAYCDNSKPVPEDFEGKLLSLLGRDSTHDTAWRRDEWLIAQGPNLDNGHHRVYLVHQWPPRFRARLVQTDEDSGLPSPHEQSADVLGGIVYAPFPSYVLSEIEWIDPIPTGARLVALLENASDAAVSFLDELDLEDPDDWTD